MNETATILQEATARSLVILDEIGRGTSTFDGVSIAWSVAEFIYDHIGAKTLFATHYHELTDLEEMRPQIKNYTVSVRHHNEDMIFLHQLVPGGASKSYGIQVARLAGLPDRVIERASEVLNVLEESEVPQAGSSIKEAVQDTTQLERPGKEKNRQVSLFSPPALPAVSSEVERAIKQADLNQMTPMQALNFLHTLAKKLKP
jgi:DNA mismatch repair protein MutS